jgi:hypothetical protein
MIFQFFSAESTRSDPEDVALTDWRRFLFSNHFFAAIQQFLITAVDLDRILVAALKIRAARPDRLDRVRSRKVRRAFRTGAVRSRVPSKDCFEGTVTLHRSCRHFVAGAVWILGCDHRRSNHFFHAFSNLFS